MKRLLIWILAWMMLFSATPGLAEDIESETVPEEEFRFVIRSGVTWESTREEVIQAENDAYHFEHEIGGEGSILALTFEEAEVSNYTAHLAYAFAEDQLVMVFYAFDGLEEEDFAYLCNALASKYEEPVAADYDRLLTLMECIEETEGVEVTDLTNWKLPDGTYIAIVRLDGLAAILYFREEVLLQLSGIYNVAGL